VIAVTTVVIEELTMCLGIPSKVVEVLDGYAGQLALVEGAQRKINIGMLDDPPAPETWVLIHMGFRARDRRRGRRGRGDAWPGDDGS